MNQCFTDAAPAASAGVFCCCATRVPRCTGEKSRNARMHKTLRLSRPQAAALARLIRHQLDAFAEADTRIPRSATAKPFTASDLELIEPLLARLKARPSPRARSQTGSP